MDAVNPGRQDLGLRAFLAAVPAEILAGLERVVAGHHVGENAPGRNRRTVGRFDQTDLALVDPGGRALGHLEQIGIDPIVAGRDDIDLRPFLAAVLDERLAILIGRVPVDRLGEDPALRDGDAVHRIHNADLRILDLGDVRLGQLEQIWVDPVFAGWQHLDLRAFLAAVLDERLAILKRVMATHHRGEDFSRRNGRPVHRFDQADDILQDFGERAFGGLVDERNQEVQTRPERARLNADLVAQRHHPPLRHFAAEPPALDQRDLIAPHDDHRLIDQHRRDDQDDHIPQMTQDELD